MHLIGAYLPTSHPNLATDVSASGEESIHPPLSVGLSPSHAT